MSDEPLPYSTAAALEVVRRGKERVSQRVERARDLGTINPDDANDLTALKGAEWFLSRIHVAPEQTLPRDDVAELAGIPELPARFSNGHTAAEVAECLIRELKMRRKVYRGLVSSEKMTQREADRETALMQTAARAFANAAALELDLS